MAETALRRLPQDPDALVLHAWLAMARENWEEGVRRWERAREAAPDNPETDVGLVKSLRLTGRLDRAEAIAKAALARHPGYNDLLVENVWLAISRKRWREAEAKARSTRDLLAARGKDSIQLGAAEYRIAMHKRAAAETKIAAERPSAEPEPIELPPVASLMLAFESIGERCDLGLTQRHYGAEPFGLLRFAFMPHDGLISVLAADFDGVGGAELEFERRDGELIAKADRHGLVFHTFTYENELTKPGKHENFYRRWFAHLKDKLIADLRAGEKILVYGNGVGLLDGEIAQLSASLRRYGACPLLCVRPADATHPDGLVEVLESGLYVGYITRFADFEAGDQPAFESWRTVCETTYRLSRRPQAEGGEQ
jgi:tetratricopeptide (TPR) repeat protein